MSKVGACFLCLGFGAYMIFSCILASANYWNTFYDLLFTTIASLSFNVGDMLGTFTSPYLQKRAPTEMLIIAAFSVQFASLVLLTGFHFVNIHLLKYIVAQIIIFLCGYASGCFMSVLNALAALNGKLPTSNVQFGIGVSGFIIEAVKLILTACEQYITGSVQKQQTIMQFCYFGAAAVIVLLQFTCWFVLKTEGNLRLDVKNMHFRDGESPPQPVGAEKAVSSLSQQKLIFGKSGPIAGVEEGERVCQGEQQPLEEQLAEIASADGNEAGSGPQNPGVSQGSDSAGPLPPPLRRNNSSECEPLPQSQYKKQTLLSAAAIVLNYFSTYLAFPALVTSIPCEWAYKKYQTFRSGTFININLTAFVCGDLLGRLLTKIPCLLRGFSLRAARISTVIRFVLFLTYFFLATLPVVRYTAVGVTQRPVLRSDCATIIMVLLFGAYGGLIITTVFVKQNEFFAHSGQRKSANNWITMGNPIGCTVGGAVGIAVAKIVAFE